MWYARLFVHNVETKEKFYVTVFHTMFIRMLEVNGIQITPEDNEEAISDRLLNCNNITITYNICEGKIIDVLNSI